MKEAHIYNNIGKLLSEFKRIRAMGKIKCCNNSSGKLGLTFEQLLGKAPDKFSVPDYCGIEIKVRHKYSKSNISLISITPTDCKSGESVVNYLINKYGYYSRKTNSDVFMGNVFGNKLSFIGWYYQYMLTVNQNDNKINLGIYDMNDKLIDNSVWWNIDYVWHRFTEKLKYLAIVNAYQYDINNEKYVQYSYISVYKLRSFNDFLNAISDGTLIVKFCISKYNCELNKGEIYNHGVIFAIDNKNIDRLFKKIC